MSIQSRLWGGLSLAAALLASPVLAQSNPPGVTFTALRAGGAAPPQLAAAIDVDADSVPLVRVVQDIAKRAGVGFTFDRTLPGLSAPVTIHMKHARAADALLHAIAGSQVQALTSPGGHVVLVRRATTTVRNARVRGVVLDTTGLAVGGARVELAQSEEKSSTVSRDDGSFTMPFVSPGDHALRVTRLGYYPAVVAHIHANEDTTEASEPLIITLDRAPVPLQAVVVSPGYFGIGTQQVEAAQSLGREEIRTRPQLGEDLFRSINRLPGLTSNDFAAGFHARGAEFDQLYVSFDGLQLHEPFHLKDLDGALSILDVKSVEGVDLTTGGFTAEYGGRLGSVLAIHSAEPRADRATTELGASVTSVRAQSQGGFASGRGTWIAAVRRGYLDLALRLAGASDSLSPRYADAFAKVTFDVNDRNHLSAHVLWADDALKYTESDNQIGSSYGSAYAWLNWDTQPAANLHGTTILSTGALSWRRTGLIDFDAHVTDHINDRRSFNVAGIRQDWSLDLGDRVLLRWGADAEQQRATYDYDATRTTRLVQDDSLLDVTKPVQANLSPSGDVLAAYVSPRVQLLPWLVTEIGARYDRASYSGDALLSPRANARIALGAHTALRVAFGRYTQPQPIYGLQTQDGVNQFAPADIAEHRVVGLEHEASAAMFRVEAYERLITREHPRYINLRMKSETFPEETSDRMLLDATSGRARGVELMARHAPSDGLAWSGSYTLASVTDLVDGRDVPRVYDQRHTLYLDASYRPVGGSWRFSLAWQTHSGWPVAPVRFVEDTLRAANGNLSTFVFTRYGPVSARGGSRLPWYQRTDLRVTRDVETSRGRISFFADIFNLFNGTNPRDYNYSIFYRGGQLVVIPVPNTQITRLPSAGVSWEF